MAAAKKTNTTNNSASNANKAAEAVANDIKKTAEKFQENIKNAAQNNAQKFQNAAQQTVQEALSGIQESFQNNIDNVSENYNKTFNNYQQQAQQMGNSFQEGINEANKNAQENINSLVEGMNTFSKSCEQIGGAYFQLIQNVFDSNVAAAKSIMQCKNANEAFDIQSNTAKENMDRIINESAKISQLGIEATNQVIEPIQNRFNNVVEASFNKKAA